MYVCFINSLINGEYSNILTEAAFSNKLFSSQISSAVKSSYLSTSSDGKAKDLAVYLSKLYWALFCSVLLLIVLIFSPTDIL